MANIKTVLDNVASGTIKLAASEYKGAYTPLPNIQVNVEGGESSDQSQTEVLFDGVKNGSIHVKIIPGKPDIYPSMRYIVAESVFEGVTFEGNEFDIPPKNGILNIKISKETWLNGHTSIYVELLPEREYLTPEQVVSRLSIVNGEGLIKINNNSAQVWGIDSEGIELKINSVIGNESRDVTWYTEEGEVTGNTVQIPGYLGFPPEIYAVFTKKTN